MLLVLPPGNYSAVVTGNGGTGVALLEVTDLRNGGLRATASSLDQLAALTRERADSAQRGTSGAPKSALELCVGVPLPVAVVGR